MAQSNFIFSNRFAWRFGRHASFWFCWFVFQVYLYAFTPSPMLTRMSFWNRIILTMNDTFWYLFANMFLAYMLMYVVIPRLVIPAKYIKATFAVVALVLFTAGLSALLSLTVIEHFHNIFLMHHPEVFGAATKAGTPLSVQLYLALISGLRGCVTIAGIAAAIKVIKYFYEKQQQALQLEQERTVAELQSLKAQLHPHFLFNTLNNIYSHTQDLAPVAADMLLGLSTLLRYMLYSCNAPLVPLKQEVGMLMEYVELEKKRYGNKLDVAIQTPADYGELMIAPLLILPFIENCFKHGASHMLENPWVNIQINLTDEIMHLKLLNGKTRDKTEQPGGIGVGNVHKRLELLYPGKYHLSILEEEEVYIVNLSVQLIQQKAVFIKYDPITNEHEGV